MDSTPQIIIDAAACTGCELCVAVCPDRTLSIHGGVATVTGASCIACDHCGAICPTGAISVQAVDPATLELTTIAPAADMVGCGTRDAASLVQLMRSRRSARQFRDTPVSRKVLEDLVKIGMTAPSGTNCQLWTFTILPSRQAVVALAEAVGRFFRRLEKRAANPLLRLAVPPLGRYWRDYHDSVRQALTEWDEHGIDRLFHGAPAAILVGMRPGASTGKEDALLASQNILLAAHAMGLGSCLIGFVVEAMAHDSTIAALVDIPADERIYAAVALGATRERWQRAAGRHAAPIRWWQG